MTTAAHCAAHDEYEPTCGECRVTVYRDAVASAAEMPSPCEKYPHMGCGCDLDDAARGPGRKPPKAKEPTVGSSAATPTPHEVIKGSLDGWIAEGLGLAQGEPNTDVWAVDIIADLVAAGYKVVRDGE